MSFSPITNEVHVETTKTYAGFWKRVGATLLDGIIVSLPIGLVAGMIFGNEEMIYSNLFTFVLGLLYKTLMESSIKQATLGKMIVGIRVADLNGDRISFGRAVGRYFAAIVSAIILFIGFMMAGWTSKKQTLHDIIAGTLVVNK